MKAAIYGRVGDIGPGGACILGSQYFASISYDVANTVGWKLHIVSTYSIVLRSALAKDVSTMDIVEYIRNAGGVEEIRLAKSPTAMSAKQKAAVAINTVVYKDIGVLAGPAVSGLMNDAGKIGANTVLIGTWQADGSIVVRAVVESDTVLTAALASHYSSIKEAAKAQAVEQKAISLEDEKQLAIAAAAESAIVLA